MINEQQFYFIGQIQTSHAGGQLSYLPKTKQIGLNIKVTYIKAVVNVRRWKLRRNKETIRFKLRKLTR